MNVTKRFRPAERDDYPHWWQRSARLRRKIQCQHLDADSIYGDEINAVGGKRGYCWGCHTYLDHLPMGFHALGERRLITAKGRLT